MQKQPNISSERQEELRSLLSPTTHLAGRGRVNSPSTWEANVPPYPGVSLIAAARVPAPPKMSEALSDLERAQICAAAFTSCIEHNFGGKCWAFRGKPLLKSRFYRALVESSEVLINLDFSPFAWCGFSAEVWKKYSDPSRKIAHPPVSFVFSVLRISERREWFTSEESTWSGGRVVFGPKHLDLVSRYKQMRQELLTTKEAHSVVAKRWFPDYERELKVVRKEIRSIQRSLNAAAEEGRWIW